MQKNSKISAALVDEFLMYYATEDKKFSNYMEKLFAVYRHISKVLPAEAEGLFKAQYIIHSIFKKNGLINKLIHHSALKHITKQEHSFLEHQIKHPWRFSYSKIADRPAENFFLMFDVFTRDSYLLYSPSMNDSLKKRRSNLWFNLITYNGACWQTYGPIGEYLGFEPDDIFFFFSELNPAVEIIDDESLMADVEENPVPYMMLMAGGNYPMVYNKNDQIVQLLSTFPLKSINIESLSEAFKIEHKHNVYKLSLKRWGEHPHFASAYYSEKKQELLCTATTERGFDKIINTFNEYGYGFDPDPDVQVQVSMLAVTEKILKRKIRLNPYENLFIEEMPESQQKETDKMNHFMRMAMPEINAGRKPDIQKLAQEAGIAVDLAQQLVNIITQRMESI
jgi:hypothetical protein